MCASIMYMTTIPVGEARQQLSSIVERAEKTHEHFDITRNGHRAAVLLSADEYDSLQETLAILSDPDLVAEIRASEDDLAKGRYVTLDEVEAELRRLGRIR